MSDTPLIDILVDILNKYGMEAATDYLRGLSPSEIDQLAQEALKGKQYKVFIPKELARIMNYRWN